MSNESSGSGIGFSGALFITFMVLKLTGVVEWAWLWVFAPLWIPLAVMLAVLLIAAVIALVTRNG